MESPINIYIHWPFCLAKCPYCDFNSHVAEAVDSRRWRAALLREIDHYADETAGRTVASIFFGGGTPSLMEPAVMADLIAAVHRRWSPAEALEVTMEANPTSVEAGRFAAFAEAGVNRISVGVQSFVDDRLAFLGRRHSAAEARRAVDLAAATFRRFSFDLIYALPGQGVAAWKAELGQALELAGGHLSLYQLTIEPGTAFHKQRVVAADEDTTADLFDSTQEVLAAAGLAAYEVSNHARPGEACRHNLDIWRGGDYAGIGPGAHGRLTAPSAAGPRTFEVRNIAAPEAWLAAVESKSHGAAHRAALDPRQRAEELLMSGLRLTAGVDGAGFRRHSGMTIEHFVDGAAFDRLIDGGYLVNDAAGVRTTPAGRLRLDTVLTMLLGGG